MNMDKTTHSVSTVSIIALFILLVFTPFAVAESDAVAKMARIVSEMNHFPSEEQKETLAEISKNENSTESTQTIADAIRNIEHKAKPEDVAELEKIAGKPSASEAEKKLADIVMDFHHKVGPEAQETLNTLAEQ